MKSTFLKSKLHRARVTDVHLDYEGSCAIDESLLLASDIKEFEMLHIYNLNNGKRFTTYAIKAEADSEIISFNGAAAFQAEKNDLVIICTYALLEPDEINRHKPKLIYFKDDSNKIDTMKTQIPKQMLNLLNNNE